MIDYIHKDLYWQDSIDKQLKIELEDLTAKALIEAENLAEKILENKMSRMYKKGIEN